MLQSFVYSTQLKPCALQYSPDVATLSLLPISPRDTKCFNSPIFLVSLWGIVDIRPSRLDSDTYVVYHQPPGTTAGVVEWPFIIRKADTNDEEAAALLPHRDVTSAPLSSLLEIVVSRIHKRGVRHILVYVSPVSGKGNGKKVWSRVVHPILAQSSHTVECLITTRARHCEDDIATRTRLGAVSQSGSGVVDTPSRSPAAPTRRPRGVTIVAIGGDGMAHEVFNGLHRRRLAGFSDVDDVVVATVPVGSGCGLATDLDVLNTVDAALSIVHCAAVPLRMMDVSLYPREAEPFSAAPANDRARVSRVAFLTVAFAIVNEIDRGSEKWRWMGNARFTAYTAQLLFSKLPTYRCDLQYTMWVSPTGETVDLPVDGNRPRDLPNFPLCSFTAECPVCVSTPLRCRRVPESEARTATRSGRFVYLMILNTPHAGRDAHLAPFSHANDGALDLSFIEWNDSRKGVPKMDFLKVFLSLEKGEQLKSPLLAYHKVSQALVAVHEGTVMLDGEAQNDASAVSVSPSDMVVHVSRKCVL